MKVSKSGPARALEHICTLLEDESVWVQIVPILEGFCSISGAQAALFYLDGQLFEIFHNGEVDDLELEAHGREMARAAEKTGQDLAYPDLSVTTRGRGASARAVQEMGLKGCVAMPLKCKSNETVSLVLYFQEPMSVKLEALESLRLARGILNLALCRERPPTSLLEDLGEPEEEMARLASLGMQLEEKVDSFRAPATAIVEELEELEFFLIELDEEQVLEERPAEYQVTRARITQAVSELRQSANYIHGGISDLQAAEVFDKKREPLLLSALGHEAMAIATPELEKSGVGISLNVVSDAEIVGIHRDVLQLIIGLIFQVRANITSDNAPTPIRTPQLCLEVRRREGFAQLRLRGIDFSNFVPNQSSNRIVESCDGTFAESSECLTVELPLMSQHTWRPPSDLNILVIDDDPALGRALRRGLAPHNVKVCASAAEGEIALLAGDYHPDSIICDLWLPGCNGLAFFERLVVRDSDLAHSFVLVSGTQPEHDTQVKMKALGCPFLKKPLNIEQLKTMVMDHAQVAREGLRQFS